MKHHTHGAPLAGMLFHTKPDEKTGSTAPDAPAPAALPMSEHPPVPPPPTIASSGEPSRATKVALTWKGKPVSTLSVVALMALIIGLLIAGTSIATQQLAIPKSGSSVPNTYEIPLPVVD